MNTVICWVYDLKLKKVTVEYQNGDGNKQPETPVPATPIVKERRRCTKPAAIRKRPSRDSENKKSALACKECNYTSTSIFKYRKHTQAHQKLYVCTNCDYQNINIYDYELHLRNHALEEPLYKCDKCAFETSWKREFVEHQTLHGTLVVRYVCKVCAYETDDQHSIDTHINNKHSFRCFLCSYQTLLKVHLLKHMNTHRYKQPPFFQCSTCSYQTTNELLYEMHLNGHKKRLALKCYRCPYKCTNMLLFYNHTKKHVRRNFKCMRCKYSTDSKRRLLEHSVNVHAWSGERPFRCRKCDFSTSLKIHYHRHRLTHLRRA